MNIPSSTALHLAGAVSLVGYLLAAFVFDFPSGSAVLVHFLPLMGGLFLIYGFTALHLKRPSAIPLGAILIWAALFRIALLFAGLPLDAPFAALKADLSGEEAGYNRFLIYDHDVWRYLWDGHLSANGHDPYAQKPVAWYAAMEAGDPEAEALFEDEVWDDIYYQMDFQGYTTVYPPLAQFLFRIHHALSPGSVFVWKLLIALLDLGVCLLLVGCLRALGKADALVLLYAWNPLVVKEYAGSGHMDPLMILCLTAALWAMLRERKAAALVLLGAAVTAKLTPALLVPLFLRRCSWKLWPALALVPAVGYGFYLFSMDEMLRGLGVFAREWVFNPGPWSLIHGVVGASAGPLCGLIALGVTAWVVLRDDGTALGFTRGCFLILAALLVFSPTVMPWYLPWALIPAILWGNRAWIVFTFLALASYGVYVDGVERDWVLTLEYLLFAAVIVWEWRRQKAATPIGA